MTDTAWKDGIIEEYRTMLAGSHRREDALRQMLSDAQQQIAAWDGVSSKLDQCVKEAEMPRGSYTPSYPPNSIAGKAEVRQHGIPRCPICGAEMMNGNNKWQCGMKHEGDPPVEYRIVGDDPPNRDFDGMEARIEDSTLLSGYQSLILDGLESYTAKIGSKTHAIMAELARRWDAEPGLRRDVGVLDDSFRAICDELLMKAKTLRDRMEEQREMALRESQERTRT